MELSQIRYFILTAQLQNMSKAARTLHITQPTLSKSISNLERELGTRLFDRSGKKLILNERGKRFLEGALVSMQELDNAAAAAQNQLINSTLQLGLFHISDGFMRCLSEFSLLHPDVILNIEHINGPADSIDTNQFDMLLYPRGVQFRRYRGQPIFTEAYLAALGKGHPLAEKNAVALADLNDENIIFIKTGKNLFEVPYYMCKSANIECKSRIFTNSLEVQRSLVAGGCGLGFVSEGCAGAYRDNPDIALRPLEGEDFTQEIMIGFKRQKHLNESGLLLSGFISQYYKLVE